MKYKLLAIDIDGTLITEDKIIAKEDKEAIEYAIKKGVIVIIASGRISASANVFAKQLDLDSYIVSSNGAMIKRIKDGKILMENILPIEEALWAVELYERENLYYHAYIGDTMYVKSLEGPAEFYTKQNEVLPKELRLEVTLCDDFIDRFNKDKDKILKVMAIDDDAKKIQKIKEEIKKNKNIMMMSSWDNNVEIMHRSVSKGRALKYLANELDIKKDQIIAIGDNENDIEMIEYAGVGVAMENAVDLLKAKADYITASVEDNGVSKAIYKFIK